MVPSDSLFIQAYANSNITNMLAHYGVSHIMILRVIHTANVCDMMKLFILDFNVIILMSEYFFLVIIWSKILLLS